MGCYFGFYFIFIFGFNVESLNLGLVCFKKGKRKKHLGWRSEERRVGKECRP